MRLLTSKSAKRIDARARGSLGISTLLLMENAGRHVAQEPIEILKDKTDNIAIFCGKGNNGADGFVAARHLLVENIRPDIFLVGRIPEVKNEARINLEILLKLKQKIVEVKEEGLYLIKNKILKYDLIIDALLGIGLVGETRGIYRDLIEIINASKGYILSVDIPSGLDATTGKVLGSCIKADRTVTFVAKKRGMVIAKGREYCGRIAVRDLGAPL